MAHAVTSLYIAQSAMRRGGIQAGLAGYEAAWTSPQACRIFHQTTDDDLATYWHGQCALPPTLRLRFRGGIGDHLLWARYVALLSSMGCTVADESGIATRLTVDPLPARGLVPAAWDLPPARAPVMWTDPFTLFVQMFRRFGYAARPSYLTPAASQGSPLAALARERAGGKPCWALFWSGNESPGNFAQKSACLEHLGALLDLDVHWVVIQRGYQMRLWMDDPRHEATTNAAQPLTLDETASTLQALDGAVVVDTAVAHLAGALGVPTCMLANEMPCWRYEKFRDSSPWYAEFAVFRQPRPGDWRGAVANAAAAVRRAGR
jgi:hypothetical protein